MSEEYVRKDGFQMAWIRKAIVGISRYSPRDDAPIDEKARDAVERVNELEERIEELEAAVDTDLDALAYEQMTKRDKVRQVRASLREEAEQSATEKASMTYKDVRWLFNGEPSPGHAYDLMALAGEEPGYNYDENGERDNRVTVNLDAVNGETAVHGANNEADEVTP